jgi:hypothetical protein
MDPQQQERYARWQTANKREAAMKKVLIGVLAGTLMWSSSAGAQQRPKLHLVIEDPGQNELSCGVDKPSIASIAALTVRNNGIEPVESLDVPWLQVQLTFIPISSRVCAYNIHVQVMDYQPISTTTFSRRKNPGRAEVVFCTSGGIYSGPTYGILKHTSETIEQHVKLCLGELNY